jgi:hypothetical protein
MQNKKYHDQIKGILLKQGYNSYDIDSRVSAVINYCNRNGLNAIEFLEKGIDGDKITKEMVDVINENRPNTSFVTKRRTQMIPNKFIRRSIIG